jgi:hypothetical protein
MELKPIRTRRTRDEPAAMGVANTFPAEGEQPKMKF